MQLSVGSACKRSLGIPLTALGLASSWTFGRRETHRGRDVSRVPAEVSSIRTHGPHPRGTGGFDDRFRGFHGPGEHFVGADVAVAGTRTGVRGDVFVATDDSRLDEIVPAAEGRGAGEQEEVPQSDERE